MNLIALARTHKERILLLVRYGLIGLVGAAVQIGAFYIWVDILKLADHYLAGSVASLALAVATTFTLQKYWTFRDTASARIPRQFASYVLIALGNLALNAFLMRLAKGTADAAGVDFFAGWHLVAQAGTVLFVAFLSFLANYFITFRRAGRPMVGAGEA